MQDTQPKDPLVEALIRLCNKVKGGYKEVASKANVNPDNLWQITAGIKLRSGRPKSVGSRVREAITSAYPDWLDDLQSHKYLYLNTDNTIAEHLVRDKLGNIYISDLQLTRAHARLPLPVITMERAAMYKQHGVPLAKEDAIDWLRYYDADPSPSAFGVIQDNDSMVSPRPGDPSFPQGTILLIEPERAAEAGDFVLALDPATQRPTFKRLATDGARWYLASLNPMYPATLIDQPENHIIGRLIESITKTKF